MESALKTTYKGVEIEYNENSDKWTFELDGRERFAQTLTNARAAVDSPERKAKAPFEKFDAYKISRWENKVAKVTVTSFVTETLRTNEAWVTLDGKRMKVDLHELYVISPETDQLLAEIRALDKEAEGLRKKSEKKRSEMKNVEPPKGE